MEKSLSLLYLNFTVLEIMILILKGFLNKKIRIQRPKSNFKLQFHAQFQKQVIFKLGSGEEG